MTLGYGAGRRNLTAHDLDIVFRGVQDGEHQEKAFGLTFRAKNRRHELPGKSRVSIECSVENRLVVVSRLG